MIQLSKRLRLIAEKVEQGSRLADIGSDHALLPAFLAQQGRLASGVAGEVNPGPLAAARKQIADAGLGRLISVRGGNGLEVIAPGEVDVITVAGMGGALIAEILEAGRRTGKLAGVARLILQPNVGEELVRRWLRNTGWMLAEETIVEEDGKIYEILVAVLPAAQQHSSAGSSLASRGQEGVGSSEDSLYEERELAGFGIITTEDWLRFGPYLLRQADPVFVEKWRRETGKLERVAQSLSLSELEESKTKRQGVLDEINRLKELTACLQKDRPLFQ
ncbi:MAG: tRNA ((1))-methyltransferase [Paenibacillaceae bacterium]|jgi:tRNA (adenine22-N1)-methyltransferase|nr:tRNA ((1))-methyltransferase [Paenibacillaceae bacterium]